MTKREISEGVENPGAYVGDIVSRGHFCLVPVFFRTLLSRHVACNLERGGMPLKDAVAWGIL